MGEPPQNRVGLRAPGAPRRPSSVPRGAPPGSGGGLWALHVSPAVASLSSRPAQPARRPSELPTPAPVLRPEHERGRRAEPWSEEDRSYALELCRRLNRRQAALIFHVFRQALHESSAEYYARWSKRDQALGARWAAEPWYFIEPSWVLPPKQSPRGDLGELIGWLERGRRLGFRNIALGRELNLGSVVAPPLEGLMRRAVELELRVATGFEPSRLKDDDPRPWGQELDHPRAIGRLLRLLAHELNLGVLGARTHHIDRWLSSVKAQGGSPEAHALLSLIKLFVRLVSPKEVVMPEPATPASEAERFVGHEVKIHGAAVSAEGDTTHWWTGMRGLRRTLAEGDKGPLLAALADRPSVHPGVALYCSLEHHDEHYAAPRLGEPLRIQALLGGNLERLSLAFACLYAAPATPAAYAGSVAEPLVRTMLALNAVRSASRPLQHGSCAMLPTPSTDVAAWLRRTSDGETTVFVANFSAEPRSSVVSREALGPFAGLAMAQFPEQRATPKAHLERSQLVVDLPAWGYAFIEVRPIARRLGSDRLE